MLRRKPGCSDRKRKKGLGLLQRWEVMEVHGSRMPASDRESKPKFRHRVKTDVDIKRQGLGDREEGAEVSEQSRRNKVYKGA